MTNCFEQLNNLKSEIKKRFKTIKHFAYSTGLEMGDVNRFINGRMKDGFDRYWDRVQDVLDMPSLSNPHEISDKEREQISVNIIVNYGSYLNFNRAHPEFSPSFITHVCNGKKKRKNAKVKKMMEMALNKPK